MNDTLDFAKSLLGIQYEWWNPDVSMIGDDKPFWAFNGPVPSYDKITSMNCAGFINLLRRFNGLDILGVSENYYYAGGTYKWCEYIDPIAEKFTPSKEYPKGTLLLRNFRDIDDQGHLALVYDEDHIIHSTSANGVCIEPTKEVYKIFDFEYAVPFEKVFKSRSDS